MALFFIDTGDGIEFKNTEAEAKALAAESLEFWKKRARDAGEWDDEVDRVCWGPVQEKVKAVAVGDGGDYTEYQLRPVDHASQTCPDCGGTEFETFSADHDRCVGCETLVDGN